MIELRKVYKKYISDNGKEFTALKDISFKWKDNTNIAIVGESGSGKSTIANMLIGLEDITKGSIIIDGKEINNYGLGDWKKLRKNLQAVFQDASGTMNPSISTYKNIEEALVNLTDFSKKERKERIYDLMDLMGLDRELLNKAVKNLSGGEQRRLSLLRALSVKPKYLILDEVTSGLDLLNTDIILSSLEKYHRQFACCYLLITHDEYCANRIADKIIHLKDGEIDKIFEKIEEEI